ncbi:MAG: apolipoprotein N-acyltransferase, partial [Planctomycetota bacterium]
ISDLFGAYGLTFCIILFAAGIQQAVLQNAKSRNVRLANLSLAILTLSGLIFYGNNKLNFVVQSEPSTINVGLIQGSIDTVFPANEEEYLEFYTSKTEHYMELARTAISDWPDADLVLWPENGWPVSDLHPETAKEMLDSLQLAQYQDAHIGTWSYLRKSNQNIPPMLIGAMTVDPVKQKRFGSAIFVDQYGNTTHRYYKNHLVMFGEYVPLADWFPILQRLPGVGAGLQAGDSPISIPVNEFKITPSICFETTVPHLIRNQLDRLDIEGDAPDLMANLTNDGWFYGTSCLDFHLACNVFRAVEMRKPHVVCANTGLSAHIDHFGRIIQEGPRRKPEAILCKVEKSEMPSRYRQLGDTLWIVLTGLTVMAMLISVFPKKT